MATAQGGSNIRAIRAAVERAFLTKFKLSEFGLKPCDPPFSIPEQSWRRDMIALAEHLSREGYRISNIAKAAQLTFDVPINDGIEKLCKMIDEDLSKSKPKPRTRGIWNWLWRRDASA